MTNLTEVNRKHFDKVASNHQNDFGELINATIAELKSRRSWISPRLADGASNSDLDIGVGDEVRLLDYACGSGTVSKALAPYATQTIGLDLSANMVSEYNNAAREIFGAHEPAAVRMEGFQHDLLGSSDTSGSANTAAGADNSPLPSGTLDPFDIIVVGMALHHVADPGRLLKRFSELLKPGGVCIVLDMVPGSAGLGDDGCGSHSDLRDGLGQGKEAEEGGVFDTIGKHGFTEAEMRDLYEESGMWRGFEYVVLEERFRFTLFGRQCSSLGFIARGEKV
ncbi:hypothetical protein BDW75DRAFT_238134 [Aspergillus navahoensis]